MNDARNNPNGHKVDLVSISFPLVSLLVGVLLILASLLPLGDLVQDALWTDEDSAVYDRISREYHRLSYEPPSRAGLTEQQLAGQREKARKHFEALRTKLQYAQQRPLAWGRFLLWAGALLAACGCLGHFVGDRK